MKTRKQPRTTTPDEQSRIIKSYSSGLSQESVAKLYDISQGTVFNILKRHAIKARNPIDAANRKHSVDETYFDAIDTPEKAYWLGFIATDGNVDKTCLSIKLGRVDSAHLAKFLTAIGSTSVIDDGINSVGSKYSRIRIHSKRIVDALLTHGITKNKTWTIEPWAGPADLMPHYWRGAIDGDGWITIGANGKTKNFYTVGLCGNANIVNGFRDYISNTLGYNNNVIGKALPGGKPFGQVAYSGTFRAKHICQHLLYNENFVALTRKNEAAIQIINYAPTQKERNFHLTDDQVGDIIADYQSDQYSHESLAQKYNIGRGTVYNIINRKGRFASS